MPRYTNVWYDLGLPLLVLCAVLTLVVTCENHLLPYHLDTLQQCVQDSIQILDTTVPWSCYVSRHTSTLVPTHLTQLFRFCSNNPDMAGLYRCSKLLQQPHYNHCQIQG